jgi:hypothetical protein
MPKTHVISVRLTVEDLAKARDGLLAHGCKPANVATTGQILKLTFFYGILDLCPDAGEPASQESTEVILQKLNKES